MKACKTPVCYVAKNTNLTHCHSPPTQLKLQEKGGTVTRPLQVLHTLQWHHPVGERWATGSSPHAGLPLLHAHSTWRCEEKVLEGPSDPPVK